MAYGFYAQNTSDGACLVSSDFSGAFFKEIASVSSTCTVLGDNALSESTGTTKAVAEESVTSRNGAVIFTYTTSGIASATAPLVFVSPRQPSEMVGLVYMSQNPSSHIWTIKLIQSSQSTNAPIMYIYTDCANATTLDSADHGLITYDDDGNVTFDSRKQPLVIREAISSTVPEIYPNDGNPPSTRADEGSASYSLDWDFASGTSTSTYVDNTLTSGDYMFSVNSLATACCTRYQGGTSYDNWMDVTHQYIYHPDTYGYVCDTDATTDFDQICDLDYVTDYDYVCDSDYICDYDYVCDFDQICDSDYVVNYEYICNYEQYCTYEYDWYYGGSKYVCNYQQVCNNQAVGGYAYICNYEYVCNGEQVCNNETVCNTEPVSGYVYACEYDYVTTYEYVCNTEVVVPSWTETVTIWTDYHAAYTVNTDTSCFYREGFALKNGHLHHGWIQYAGDRLVTESYEVGTSTSVTSTAPWFVQGSDGSVHFVNGNVITAPPPSYPGFTNTVGSIPYTNSNTNIVERLTLIAKKPII